MRFKIIIIIFLSYSLLWAINLTRREFTAIMTNRIIEQFPEKSVSILSDTEIYLSDSTGSKFTINTETAYERYALQPALLDSIVNYYLEFYYWQFDTLCSRLVSADYIVPIIKDTAFVEYINNILEKNGGVKFEKLNNVLYICYALDGVTSISYLSNEKYAEFDIGDDSLRQFAADNLLRILPDITGYKGDGCYLITGGGDYDASLLLIDDIWDNPKISVKGDFVAAVPARSWLAVTGSEDSLGLKRIREFVKEYEDFPYPITDRLFIRKNHTWEIYPEDPNVDQEKLEKILRTPLYKSGESVNEGF